MILPVAAFLSALGLGAWVIGHYHSYFGIAVIGAVLVVGVGAGVMLGGLEVHTATAETIDRNATTVINDTTTDTTENLTATATAQRTQQYQSVNTQTTFPLGVLITLLGGTMTLRALDELRVI